MEIEEKINKEFEMNMKDILGMVGLAFGVMFCMAQSVMSVPVEAQDGVTANAMVRNFTFS